MTRNGHSAYFVSIDGIRHSLSVSWLGRRTMFDRGSFAEQLDVGFCLLRCLVVVLTAWLLVIGSMSTTRHFSSDERTIHQFAKT